MATLAVWKFNTPKGAAEAAQSLREQARRGVVVVEEAATVSWEQAAKKPTSRQLAGTATAPALGSSFWGLLFGLIFLVPLLGAAMGAATGAVAGSLMDVGIDDTFINKVRDQITPGTSALFVLSPDAVMNALEVELATYRPVELTFTTLDAEQEKALRWVFTE
jgi:uncharacterized membrane protein